ncbi:helix-turn-helix transcriptional regulator [Terrarubrum flagellatum]|uniref:ArsR/SmtB family transcription factor n=1 Tax=Terrirubrum flagellatum TaxID=2895980 RepID=UPI003144F526
MKLLPQPDIDSIDVATVFAALGDPTRLAICLMLAETEEAEARCGHFYGLAGASNLTYHFAKLREAGVTSARIQGTARYISLRREELDRRFPGLLDAALDAARLSRGSLPALPSLVDEQV